MNKFQGQKEVYRTVKYILGLEYTFLVMLLFHEDHVCNKMKSAEVNLFSNLHNGHSLVLTHCQFT